MADAYRNNRRYIRPLHWTPASTSLVSPADGRIAAMLFEVTCRSTVLSIQWVNGAAVQDNIYVGIYSALYTSAGDPTMTGGTLLYTSGELTQSGTNTSQKHTLTSSLVLEPGLYYMVIETEGTTTTYMRQANQQQILGAVQFATLASFLPLPATAPTMTNTGSNACAMMLEVSIDPTDRTLYGAKA